MAKKKNSKKEKDIAGQIFVGFLFVGIGFGALFGNIFVGSLFGLGAGFIAKGIFEYITRK
jgi:predicted MFS family arabinose efflux permease